MKKPKFKHNNTKIWVCIDKFNNLVRDFGDKIYIRCKTIRDANDIKTLLEKIGHKNVIAAESTNCISPTTNITNNPEDGYYY